jgi:hypothetical protein
MCFNENESFECEITRKTHETREEILFHQRNMPWDQNERATHAKNVCLFGMFQRK